MSVKPLGAEGWLVDVRPQGRGGRRFRKKFTTKSEAQQYERWLIATQNNKDWVDKPADRRTLAELIQLWWLHHGQTLKDGKAAKRKLEVMDLAMKGPRADQITHAFFSEFRSKRLTAGKKSTTLNREQERLSGVFGALISLGLFHNENPLSNFKKMRVTGSEMGFLRTNEIAALLAALTGDNLLVVKVCLATGARWSEAVGLRSEHAIGNRVTFVNTKNWKNRTVPVSAELFKEITDNKRRGLFPDVDYYEVIGTLKRIAPHLPKGQAVHVLRHTFASHFMMNGGNILALQKILGHATITQTMVYSHFAPDYLMDAVRFNPLESK